MSVDGHFSIKANNYDVLVISYVGFEDKEIPIQENQAGQHRIERRIQQDR